MAFHGASGSRASDAPSAHRSARKDQKYYRSVFARWFFALLLTSMCPSPFGDRRSSASEQYSYRGLSVLAGFRFSSASAPWPAHHGIRRMKRFNLTHVLTSNVLPILDTERTHLTHRPANNVSPMVAELDLLPFPGKSLTISTSRFQRNSVPSSHSCA